MALETIAQDITDAFNNAAYQFFKRYEKLDIMERKPVKVSYIKKVTVITWFKMVNANDVKNPVSFVSSIFHKTLISYRQKNSWQNFVI